MYFQTKMSNPQYVNPMYYSCIHSQMMKYSFDQNTEMAKAVKAARDMCEAVKKMDDQHRKRAFTACLAVMAEEFNW